MEEAASQLERDHVHSVYDKIAPYFNDSRYKAWPKVRQFLLDMQPGSIVADIGGCPLRQSSKLGTNTWFMPFCSVFLEINNELLRNWFHDGEGKIIFEPIRPLISL